LQRYINDLYTASVGEPWANPRLLPYYEEAVERLPLEDEPRRELRDFIRYQMLGERVRRTAIPNWTPTSLSDFNSRANAYERGAEEALAALAPLIKEAAEGAGVKFDAVLTTTSTGNLMPGLSYRMAQRLSSAIRADSLLFDLANVGCTGSCKALNLARSLDDSFQNILVVAIELPTTLIDMTGTNVDLWQGNCTFGDGAAALWISNDPEQGALALEIEEMRYQQFAEKGLELIRWGYRNYYNFALADQTTFENDVGKYVSGALREVETSWRDVPLWAIHAAGITLLMRVARSLNFPKESIRASADHYRDHSNMSSASILFVLKELAEKASAGTAINLLSMGAGFNVVYGRVRRTR
jgi:predicted naringenin-chalcone synthase